MSVPSANDVNMVQVPSPDPGVTAAPPPATDVNAQDPSTGDPNQTQEPAAPAPHEQTVPYDRFAEVNQRNADLQAQIDAINNQSAQPDASQGEQQPYGFDPQQPQQQQQEQPMTWDQIEERVSQDMYTKPVSTMTPIIREIFKNMKTEERQQEARVRGIPDFKNFEQAFYNVPEDLVQQAQSDPTLVKFLLAKHKETLAGQGQGRPAQGAPNQQNPQNPQNPQQPGTFLDSQQPQGGTQPPTQPAGTDPMEVLREQYRKEGEQRALENLRKQQGVTSEGTANPANPPATGQAQLDEYGTGFMNSLGIPADQHGEVAGRLNSFVKGD